VADLAAKVFARAGTNGRIEHGDPLPGDIREFDVDNRLISSELGMKFETDFDRGLGHTLDWAIDAFKTGAIK
jgi:nucleoside-diphosphate-sugar epimerase